MKERPRVRSVVDAAETVAQRIEAERAKALPPGAEALACATRDEGTFDATGAVGAGPAARGGTSGTMADRKAVNSRPLER